MNQFIQQLVNAVTLGGTYALLALGLAMVFSVLGMINFAHGELMTIAGYAIFFLLAARLPFEVAVVLALVVGGLAGMLMERVAFRPVRGSNGTTLLVTSFAVSLLLQVVFQNTLGARPKPVPVPNWMDGTIDVGQLALGRVQVVSLVTVLAVGLVLNLVMQRTTLGLSLRAAATDFSTVRLMGIKANRTISVAFALSGVLAAVAGVLWVAQRGSVDPLMGFLPVLKAFLAAVIGGLGNLWGAAAGGFLLGLIEVSLQAWLPAGAQPYRDAFVLAVVIGVLLLRPNGIFARVTEVKV
ncbi:MULTISPECIES: branched-chain amino acid ABC transporter permease [unclassified Mycolicibacterium]|uniref:branched-chain amino acid ABC transporter permease n=1 Tax=unclassified Mycolicibacterium TaxID=2636767 RepID=UPI0012DDF45F|nr:MULTISPECIES: branched-chain amino acid ABC transporter permease [unclassified Mycolicibacterium]MUL84746.1 branched-chain amino acid ABC transporter permease [Mycolicibacterium sp. CBMA 329]MUL88521.1 branched-chain amino acid ABC transporter permease [Mycolicibacterium sp. CBMA 331]MUM00140.1 branched-chain amino acid ABC transporter permease [Mycolicibacterium sp. CBMA 334]MUM27804.1 branched-chain amino acid ABC transporter permease [Mycolicibacterium sp. CBMA 295]MUM40168.1 branched-ch